METTERLRRVVLLQKRPILFAQRRRDGNRRGWDADESAAGVFAGKAAGVDRGVVSAADLEWNHGACAIRGAKTVSEI